MSAFERVATAAMALGGIVATVVAIVVALRDVPRAAWFADAATLTTSQGVVCIIIAAAIVAAAYVAGGRR